MLKFYVILADKRVICFSDERNLSNTQKFCEIYSKRYEKSKRHSYEKCIGKSIYISKQINQKKEYTIHISFDLNYRIVIYLWGFNNKIKLNRQTTVATEKKVETFHLIFSYKSKFSTYNNYKLNLLFIFAFDLLVVLLLFYSFFLNCHANKYKRKFLNFLESITAYIL